jgi:hypothetical protein
MGKYKKEVKNWENLQNLVLCEKYQIKKEVFSLCRESRARPKKFPDVCQQRLSILLYLNFPQISKNPPKNDQIL